jgi:hypothetical protein
MSNSNAFDACVNPAAKISRELFEKLEELSGGPFPNPRPDYVYVPNPLIAPGTWLVKLEWGAEFCLIVLLVRWIGGVRIFEGRASDNSYKKRRLNVLRRRGLILYDDIRDILILDEVAVLAFLNEAIPSTKTVKGDGR